MVDSSAGSPAVGLSFDERGGLAFVYDPDTEETAAAYTLTAPGSFVNDVIVTNDAAYFTDPFRPYPYRLPLGPARALPEAGAPDENSIPS